LLQRINASEFGNSGWGKIGSEAAFAEGTKAKHQTSANSKTCGFYSQERVHKMVESFYAQDYLHPMLNFSRNVLAESCN
jgi:hypothetical protein